MKKRILCVVLLMLCAVMLTACQCQHDWVEADCTTGKTCTRCDEVIGEALGHSWIEASCTSAKTCSACGREEGSPVEHVWQSATCTKAKTCRDCGKVTGEALNHSWASGVNKSGIEGCICEQCGEVIMMTEEWTPLTDCEKIAVSNSEAHLRDLVVGDWETRFGKLPDSIRFCVSNKKDYKNTHYCVYKLNGEYNWLSGLISLSDKSEKFATAKIHIYLDNELAYESEKISANSSDYTFTLNTEGVEVVRIVCSTTDMPSAYCVLSASVF